MQGGLTTYNLGQKSGHLLVEPIDAQENDCVSEAVVLWFTRQILEAFVQVIA